MKFSKYVRRLQRNNRIVLVNYNNRNWYKMSKEIYDIVIYGIEKNYNCDELLGLLCDEEDRNTISKVIYNLKELGLILEDYKNDTDIKLNFTLALTDRCNLSCKHCSYSAKFCQNTSETITYEQMKERLGRLLLLKPSTITFTGGEPMVRDDFMELSSWLKKEFDKQIYLMTNGTLINEKNVKQITHLFSQIDISIDGVDENTCSKIRGKAVFGKIVEVVKLLQNNNFDKISLSMVDTRITHPYISKFYQLNKTLKTHPILRSFSTIGRGEANREEFELQEKDYLNYKEEMPMEFKQYYHNNFKASGCGAGIGNFFVDYDGTVYGCATLREFGYKLGCINDINKTIDFNNNIVYKSMIQMIPEKCKSCDNNIFCIECLADFIEINKNSENSFEKFCIERKRCLDDVVWGME